MKGKELRNWCVIDASKSMALVWDYNDTQIRNIYPIPTMHNGRTKLGCFLVPQDILEYFSSHPILSLPWWLIRRNDTFIPILGQNWWHIYIYMRQKVWLCFIIVFIKKIWWDISIYLQINGYRLIIFNIFVEKKNHDWPKKREDCLMFVSQAIGYPKCKALED